MSAVKPTGRVVGASAADTEAGDIVKSKWSSSGALWRIVDIFGRPGFAQPMRANLISVKSGRADTRALRDLKIVEVHE